MPTTTPQTLQRLPDWPERLADFLQSRRLEPFAWGSNDCCCFVADAIAAMTGTDLATSWRGTYDSETGAARVLVPYGSVYGLAVAKLGQPLDVPALAQRGDVVWVAPDGRQMLGIVTGGGDWCAPGDDGLVFFPMADVAMVWRV